MAVDHSIYFQQQAPDILGQVSKGMRMSDMIADRKLKDQKRQALAQKQQRDRQARDLFASSMSVGPDGKPVLDRNKYMAGLAQLDPEKYQLAEDRLYTQEMRKNQLEGAGLKQSADKLELGLKKVNALGQLLNGANAENWDNRIQKAHSMGLIDDVSSVPRVFDQGYVDAQKMQALSLKDHINNQLANANLELKRRGLDIQEQGVLAKQKEAEGRGAQQMQKLATDLRKERSSLPVTKATMAVSAAYNKVQNSAQKPTAAGDLSMIFNYMKMLDPGSVVREGEFANAQNAAGIPDRVRNSYNQALRGTRLGPDQRREFVESAKGVYEAQMAAQDQVDQNFAGLASKHGVDPEDVLVNFAAQAPKQDSGGGSLTKEEEKELAALEAEFGDM